MLALGEIKGIDALMSNLMYGGSRTWAVFELEPSDQFAFYRPMDSLQVIRK